MVTGNDFSLYVNTGVLCCGTVFLGLPIGLVGPTIPDISQRLRVSLGVFEYIFLSSLLPTALGCLLVARMEKVLGSNLLLFLVYLTHGICAVILPFSPHLAVFAVCYGVIIFCNAVASPVTYSLVARLWGERSPPIFHLVACAFSLGMGLGPLLASPFLSPPSCLQPPSPHNHSSWPQPVLSQWPPQASKTDGRPGVKGPLGVTLADVNVTSHSTADVDCGGRVYLAYISMAAMGLPAILGYFLICLCERVAHSAHQELREDVDDQTTEDSKNTCNGRKVILVTVGCLYVSIAFAVNSIATLMTSFGVASPVLHVTLQTMSTMTSVTVFASALGRAGGGVLSKFFSQTSLLMFSLLGLLGSGLMLVLAGRQEVTWFWVAMSVYGFFMGPQYGGILALTRDHVTLTTSVIAILLLSGILGFLGWSYVTALLMTHVDNDAFVYVCLFFPVAMLVLLASIKVVARTSSAFS